MEKLERKFDGGDSQGGLVGKFNELDKKIDNKFNELNNTIKSETTSIDNLNKVVQGNDGQGGLVGRIDQLNQTITKLESSSWKWQAMPNVVTVVFATTAIIATLFAGYFALSGGIAKDVEKRLEPRIGKIEEDYGNIQLELTNIKKTQGEILNILNNENNQ